MWLTLLAVRNAIAVLMAALAIVVLGATSLGRLSVDLFPNINQPVVTIGTIYTGANVQDIEKTVTYPIEKAVSAVPGVRHVESRSRPGISAVQVWFNYDADLNSGQNEIIQRIQQISNSLPSGIKQPFIVKFDLSNIPVCLITVSGGGIDEKRLYDIAYNTIEPQLERVNGVASANVDGGKIRQIAVNLDRDLLYAKAISVLDVVRSVNDSNFLMPSGDVRIGTVDYKLLTNNQFQLVKPMEDIVVRKIGDTPVRVRDLGYVSDSHETQSSVVRVNGERAVYLRVNKQPSANTIEVVDAVKALVPQLTGVPPGVSVGLTFDQSTYIRQSINSLWHESLQGALLAFLVILLFLRSFVSTAIIFVAIPLSILCTLIAMYFLGQTLNIFTLGGLALAVGRLVDDSIVELENINRHLAMPGKDRRAAVLDAAREVAMPIFVSTITTIVVFLPTIFLEGQSKLLFIPLTFTISFSLFASFLVSRTVTPLMCLRILRSPASAGSGQPRIARPLHAGEPGVLRSARRGVPGPPALGARPSQGRGGRGARDLPREPRARAADRDRVLPGLRREPVPGLPARPDRDSGRGDGEGRRPGRAADPPEPPAGGARVDRVHRRHPGRPLGDLHGEHRPARRPGPGVPGDARPPDAERRGDRGGPPAALQRRVPGHADLLQPGWDREPGPEPRIPESPRGGGARLRLRRRPGGRPRGGPDHARRSGRRRRADQPRGQLSRSGASSSTGKRPPPPASRSGRSPRPPCSRSTRTSA